MHALQIAKPIVLLPQIIILLTIAYMVVHLGARATYNAITNAMSPDFGAIFKMETWAVASLHVCLDCLLY